MRKKPNILIPKSVYHARREHYIYWDMSRVARGLNKTFSYHNYDPTSVIVIIKIYRNYYISLTGKEITTLKKFSLMKNGLI